MGKSSEQPINSLPPLAGFYAAEGLAMPCPRFVDGREIPEPYRRLLVHKNDMTSTLEEYFGGPIHLKLLGVNRGPQSLFRQVVLVENGDERPVEFGAIRIELDRFDEPAREMILSGYRPLGAILREHRIAYRSRPVAFFCIEADAKVCHALGLSGRPLLYGRHNEIFDAQDRVLAEVVEILPVLGEE